jgi:cystathionine beta-lyase/cystathionine gamma-synthase
MRHELTRRGLSTIAVHGSGCPEPLAVPIERATASAGPAPGQTSYGRISNPTVDAVARRLAAIEGAEDALLLASGTSALLAALLATVPPSGHLVAARQVCGDAHRLLVRDLRSFGRQVTLVDLADREAWTRETSRADAIFVEALSNPLLGVADLPWLGDLAARAGADLVVDATLATPVNIQPLRHGATLVVHSATKGLNGHSDVVAGVVCGAHAAVARVREVAAGLGACLDPGAAALLERGLKTLCLRVERQNETARLVATALAGRPGIAAVFHPSLDGHPDSTLAARILGGTAGLVSLTVEGGEPAAELFVASLTLIRGLPTLGGVESLASTVASGTHRDLSHLERAAAGNPAGTVRLALGIEDLDDLLGDLESALAVTVDRRSSAPSLGGR